jgi:U3 small nucleolar RNA-associated protein 15
MTSRYHCSSVRSVYFTIDKLRVVSASDDMTVRITDIPSEQCLLSLHHADRVRAQTPCPASPHLWLTGCYDGAVRLFDLRLPSQKPVRMVWHAQHGQVDDVCFLDSESSTFVASGGGSSVRCWELLHSSSDVEAGSQRALLAELEPHRKAVMSLALDATRRRLLSVSLDGALKVHDLSVLSTLHTRSIGAGCLCMDLSADGRSLATGHVDGQLRIERRGVSKPSGIENETNVDERSGEPDWASLARGHLDRGDALRPYRPGTRRYFLRGMYAKPDSDIDDVILGDGDSTSGTSRRRRRRRQHDQKPYDHHLRRFAYDKALSAVLETNQSGLIVSMLVELDRRKGLQNALSSLNEQEMITLIEFIAKHIADSRYIQVLVPVSHLIVDMHHTKDSLSGSLLAALQRLAARVQQQVHHLGDMEKMAAAIELFLS